MPLYLSFAYLGVWFSWLIFNVRFKHSTWFVVTCLHAVFIWRPCVTNFIQFFKLLALACSRSGTRGEWFYVLVWVCSVTCMLSRLTTSFAQYISAYYDMLYCTHYAYLLVFTFAVNFTATFVAYFWRQLFSYYYNRTPGLIGMEYWGIRDGWSCIDIAAVVFGVWIV